MVSVIIEIAPPRSIWRSASHWPRTMSSCLTCCVVRMLVRISPSIVRCVMWSSVVSVFCSGDFVMRTKVTRAATVVNSNSTRVDFACHGATVVNMPKKKQPAAMSERTMIRLTPDEHEAFMAEAARLSAITGVHVTVGAWLRLAGRAFIGKGFGP